MSLEDFERIDNQRFSGRIGMLVPSGNIVAEDQVRSLLPDDIALHITRLPLTCSSDEALSAMIDGLPQSAGLLADARVDLIAFNCTAVSTRAPEADAEIVDTIQSATSVPAITTGDALVCGLSSLGCRRIVLVTPYIDPVVEREAAFFEHHGFEVLAAVGSGISSNWDMALEPPETWRDLVLRHRNPQADAYVLSCTAIRSLSVIAPLETELGRPVLTSNQAVTWHAMRSIKAQSAVPDAGRLFDI